jgi:hypothetical protein
MKEENIYGRHVAQNGIYTFEYVLNSYVSKAATSTVWNVRT